MKEKKPEYESVATFTYAWNFPVNWNPYKLTKKEAKELSSESRMMNNIMALRWEEDKRPLEEKMELVARAKIDPPVTLLDGESIKYTTHIVVNDDGNIAPDKAYITDVKVIKEEDKVR